MNIYTLKLKIQHILKPHKKMKYLNINLTNLIQDSYAENYPKLVLEIKDVNKWEHIVLMDWKIQHSKYVDSLQIDMQI